MLPHHWYSSIPHQVPGPPFYYDVESDQWILSRVFLGFYVNIVSQGAVCGAPPNLVSSLYRMEYWADTISVN